MSAAEPPYLAMYSATKVGLPYARAPDVQPAGTMIPSVLAPSFAEYWAPWSGPAVSISVFGL